MNWILPEYRYFRFWNIDQEGLGSDRFKHKYRSLPRLLDLKTELSIRIVSGHDYQIYNKGNAKKDTEKYDFSYRICRPRSLPAGIKKTYNSFTVVRLQVDALSATVCYDMLCCIFQRSMSGMMGAYRCILTQKRHDCAPFGGQSDINAYDHI